MLKWILCLALGHKVVIKYYTGEGIQVNGIPYMEFDFRRYDFCTRCGKPTKESRENANKEKIGKKEISAKENNEATKEISA